MSPIFSDAALVEQKINQSLINFPVVKRLVYKDWHLNRKLIATYVGGGIFGLSIISLGEWQFFFGAITFLSMMVGLGNHQIAVTMINERKEQTLPFIMSLPVSPTDYAIAKLLSNMVTFFVPWFFLTAMVSLIILVTPMYDGFLPFAVLVCVLVALNHCVTWSIGMATESEGAIMGVMIGLNCLLNPALYFLARSSEINSYFKSPDIYWSGLPFQVLLLEILAIVGVIGLSLYLQTRKKVFY
jgi:ABC-2 type transport system permease protein